MEILKTKDYSLFKFIMSNRDVDQNHVRKLAKSIEQNNLLYIRPLICNDKMQLIDGQHRLEAAKAIGAEVYYLKVPHLTKAHIAVLNSAQKNWTRTDFVNFYAMEGNEHYKELAKLIDHYYWISPTIIIQITGGENQALDLKGGGYKLRDLKKSTQVLEWLRVLEARFDFVKQAGCARAIAGVIKSQKDFETFNKRANEKTFHKCADRGQYQQQIEALLA
jgi:hypothetical protein